MTNLYKKLVQFFEEDFSGLPTIVVIESPTKASINSRPGISSAPFLYKQAPRLAVTGGLLHNTLGTTQTLTFSVEYPNPVQPEPNLIVDIYVSDDGTTYTLDTSTTYDSLPVNVTTDKEYILGLIRTNASTPKILFTTRDAEKGYHPIDVRQNEVDLLSYTYSGNTLKGTFPLFLDVSSNELIVDFSYRGTESFADSNATYASGDAVHVKSWDAGLSQLVLVGIYFLGTFTLPKEHLFPVGSPKFINGDVVSRVSELKTLVDVLVTLAKLQKVDTTFSTMFTTLWGAFSTLQTESTTGLFYSTYGIDGNPASSVVDIAANAYLALRFLSSEAKQLVDFVTVPSGGQTFLGKLGDVVSVPDGHVLFDSYDGTTFEDSFKGFTEGVFYLLARLVEKEYPALVPSSFSSSGTLNTLATYVNTGSSEAYCSKKEADGDPSAPERNSLDLAGLFVAFNSVPITPTEDYSVHAGIVKSALLGFKITNGTGIPINVDANSPDYNPYWAITPPLVGYKNFMSESDIDSKISLLVDALVRDVDLSTSLLNMDTDEGVLYVDRANVPQNKYIVPNLHATVLSVLNELSSSFIKVETYTVQVLDNLPNNVSVLQTPTNQGVTLDIILDYPSGIVALAVGDSSGTSYDSVVITTESINHTIYLRIPVVQESVKIYILPIRPTTVT